MSSSLLVDYSKRRADIGMQDESMTSSGGLDESFAWCGQDDTTSGHDEDPFPLRRKPLEESLSTLSTASITSSSDDFSNSTAGPISFTVRRSSIGGCCTSNSSHLNNSIISRQEQFHDSLENLRTPYKRQATTPARVNSGDSLKERLQYDSWKRKQRSLLSASADIATSSDKSFRNLIKYSRRGSMPHSTSSTAARRQDMMGDHSQTGGRLTSQSMHTWSARPRSGSTEAHRPASGTSTSPIARPSKRRSSMSHSHHANYQPRPDSQRQQQQHLQRKTLHGPASSSSWHHRSSTSSSSSGYHHRMNASYSGGSTRRNRRRSSMSHAPATIQEMDVSEPCRSTTRRRSSMSMAGGPMTPGLSRSGTLIRSNCSSANRTPTRRSPVPTDDKDDSLHKRSGSGSRHSRRRKAVSPKPTNGGSHHSRTSTTMTRSSSSRNLGRSSSSRNLTGRSSSGRNLTGRSSSGRNLLKNTSSFHVVSRGFGSGSNLAAMDTSSSSHAFANNVESSQFVTGSRIRRIETNSLSSSSFQYNVLGYR